MESEERPIKIPKLSHTTEDEDVRISASTQVAIDRSISENGTSRSSHFHNQLSKSSGPRSDDPTKAMDVPLDSQSTEHSAPSDKDGDTDARADRSKTMTGAATDPPLLSKSAHKKLLRRQARSDFRKQRKAHKKAVASERKQAQRAEREALLASGQPIPPHLEVHSQQKQKQKAIAPQGPLLPLTLVLDCSFDELMGDGETISLTSQITRCYNEVRHARWRTGLAVCGYGGRLRHRFEDTLQGQYRSWKGVRVLEEGCVEVAELAKDWMRADDVDVVGLKGVDRMKRLPEHLRHFSNQDDAGSGSGSGSAPTAASDNAAPPPHHKNTDDEQADSEPQRQRQQQQQQQQQQDGEVVYLSSESPNLLAELLPHSTYIIGGLVDRNRHKGVCYQRACELGLRTARLPIGEHVFMKSRVVLATNHVVEIMLRWLELGDWGEAFMKVIPKRKGGVLKKDVEEGHRKGEDGEEAIAEKEEEVEAEAEAEAEAMGEGGL